LGSLLKDPDFRSKVFICTKFGMIFDQEQDRFCAKGTPKYVREACEESLKNLQVGYIDLYYQHRASLQPFAARTVGAHVFNLDS